MKTFLIMLICLFVFSNSALSELTEENLRQIQEIVDKSVEKSVSKAMKEHKDEMISWLKWGSLAMLTILILVLTLYATVLIHVLGRESNRIDQQMDRAVDLILEIVGKFRTDSVDSVELIKKDIRAYAKHWKKEIEEAKQN